MAPQHDARAATTARFDAMQAARQAGRLAYVAAQARGCSHAVAKHAEILAYTALAIPALSDRLSRETREDGAPSPRL